MAGYLPPVGITLGGIAGTYYETETALYAYVVLNSVVAVMVVVAAVALVVWSVP